MKENNNFVFDLLLLKMKKILTFLIIIAISIFFYQCMSLSDERENQSQKKTAKLLYKEIYRAGQVYVKCKEAGEVVVGRPKNLDSSVKYYEEGMEAAKLKDYRKASDMLRHSYYQNPDSYRFFWYLYHLSFLKAWEAIDWEAGKAKEEFLFNAGYLTRARSIWASALKEIGDYEKSVEQYVYILKNNPKSAFDAAYILTEHYWASDKLGPTFLKRPDHIELIEFITTRIEKDWTDKKYNGNEIFKHIIIAASTALEQKRISDAKFYINSLKRIDKKSDYIENIEPYGNRKSILRAFDYYLTNPPDKVAIKPYRFNWLNIYIPEIDAVNPKNNEHILIKLDDKTVDTRINDTKLQWAFASIFYYYISQGKVIMDYEYEVWKGKYTKIASRSSNPPEISSLKPYPTKLLYDNIKKIDGIMWWHPSYEGTSYLGGPRGVVLVPGILETKDWKSTTTMVYGGSYGVLIHEIFHNYANRLGIDSGHNWLLENTDKHFESYKKTIESSPDGKMCEHTWYELLLREDGNVKDHSKLLNRDTMWIPNEASVKTALDYYNKIGDKKLEEVNELINKANEEFNNKNNEKGIDILQKALSISPDNPTLLYKIGHHYHWSLNKRDDAQTYYDKYLELYSDFQSTDLALTYSISYYIYKDPGKVLDLLKKNGANPPSYVRLSEYKLAEIRALKNLKRDDEAKKIALEFLNDTRNTMKDKFLEFSN